MIPVARGVSRDPHGPVPIHSAATGGRTVPVGRPTGAWLGVLLLLLVLAVSGLWPSGAEAVQVSGAMELAAWGRFRIPHGGTWRTRFDLALEEALDVVDIRVHGRLEARDGEAAAASLREATLRLSAGELRWVAGRQVVAWGSGILVQPTALVNPRKYVDAEPEWVPVDAVATYWQGTGEWSGALIWIPAFVPETDRLPDGTVVERPPAVFDYSQWTGRAEWRRAPYRVGLVASRGLDRKPAEVEPGQEPYLWGTTLGVEVMREAGPVKFWLEGAYSNFDRRPDGRAELVVGLGHTSRRGIYRALQWHHKWDKFWGDQSHLMFVMETDIAEVHKLKALALVDLQTEAFRVAPTFEYAISEATTASLTIAYVNDSRGPLTLPLSNNEVRFHLTTRF